MFKGDDPGVVEKEVDWKIVKPQSVTAIEAAIEKYGENFHKDGFHLNDVGRYIAALTFVHTFNNNKPIKNLYVPEFLSKEQCQRWEDLVRSVL